MLVNIAGTLALHFLTYRALLVTPLPPPILDPLGTPESQHRCHTFRLADHHAYGFIINIFSGNIPETRKAARL